MIVERFLNRLRKNTFEVIEMLFKVLYYDICISYNELQRYEVEAIDEYQAEKIFKIIMRGEPGITIYSVESV